MAMAHMAIMIKKQRNFLREELYFLRIQRGDKFFVSEFLSYKRPARQCLST